MQESTDETEYIEVIKDFRNICIVTRLIAIIEFLSRQ